jgi:HlyD family secretion protein
MDVLNSSGGDLRMKDKTRVFLHAIRKRRRLLTIIAALSAVAIFVTVFWRNKADASDYLTARAERSSVSVTVSATGTLQAVTTVQVGSQASGTVAWLGADFNSEVKRGQVIARLDSTTYDAQIESARASVANAEAAVQAAMTEATNQAANVQAAKANLDVARVQSEDAASLANRYKDLKNVLPGRDIESAQAQASVAEGRVAQANAQVAQAEASRQASSAKIAQAKAQLAQASAQLEQAQANLSHTVITSPIDGVVVSRNVDVGQTVAASLQAPTLFTIANDLTKMQVMASVDEADVGQIKQGIKANFTVDAFAGETFTGVVSQVRLNAQATQNVVTYMAVIDVSNPELKLRPGMTTNITFPVEERENVLTVPNAALRFKPELSEKEQQELREQMQARRQGAGAGDQGSGGREQNKPGSSSPDSQTTDPRPQTTAKGQMVWVLVGDGKLEPRFVRTGLTNGRVTEITAGTLKEGETVVIGKNDTNAKSPQQQTSPFGPQGGRGMGGGRTGGGQRR